MSVITENWWALLAVVGGSVSIGIDVFLFIIAWRLYHWLNQRAAPVASVEERLIALERTVEERGRMLEAMVHAVQAKKD